MENAKKICEVVKGVKVVSVYFVGGRSYRLCGLVTAS